MLPATVEFVDIAGIVRGASEGEGLGNKFLSHIRESAAICQVTRVFRDEDVTHVDGEVNPASDISTIQTEMILADLQTVEKALPRLEKEARIKKDSVAAPRGDARRPRRRWRRARRSSPRRSTASLVRELSPADREALHLRLQLRRRRARPTRTSSSGCATWSRRPRRSSSTPSSRPSWSSSATTTRRGRCSRRWASTSPASTCWPASASTPSGLQTYLTAGPKESRAWTIPKGATAPEAAGVIHTDFQRGFIKAEIVSYDDLVAAGSMAAAKAGRQGPHGGQGLRDGRRRRRGVPLQRLGQRTAMPMTAR